MADVDLDKATDRIDAGEAAGDEYTDGLEKVRDELDTATGSTLGTMVGAQIEMTELDTTYQVTSALPKKASGAVNAAAGDVKKAGG